VSLNGDKPKRPSTEPGLHAAVAGAMGEMGLAAQEGTRLSATEIAQAWIKLGGGNGNGSGVPPERHAKSLKRHNWMTTLLVLLFGSGGIVASYYATKHRSETNSTQIEEHKAKPMHDGAAEEYELIKVRIVGMETKFTAVEDGQLKITKGIDELKQENVKRLEDEKTALEREVRRLRRDRDR
jgi:hypothetical protein